MKTAGLQNRAILSRGTVEEKGTISSATSFGTYSRELVRVQAVPLGKMARTEPCLYSGRTLKIVT
jgi:hypothetical protein